MLCPRCRNENDQAAASCARCGAPLALRPEPTPRPLDRSLPLDRRQDPPPPPVPARAPAPRPPPPAAPLRTAPPAPQARPPAPAPPPAPRPAPPPPPDVDPDVSVEEIEVHLRRAPPWRRAASWAVDGLLLGLLGAFLFSLVASMGGLSAAASGPSSRQTGLDWLLDAAVAHQGLVLPTLAVLAAASCVHATLGHALMGATLGKRLLGLQVVGRDGRRPGLGRSATRAALALVSFLALGLGCLLALFTVSGRALHDFLAGTYVVERDRTLP